MPSPKIFVPYSIDPNKKPFELYTILCEESEQAYRYEIYDPLKPYTKDKGPQRIECYKKLNALRENVFKETEVRREFHLLRDGKDIPKAVIHDNTQSVFLGLYLTLYQKIKNMRFNADWTTITVTGDIKIKGKNVEPSLVSKIPQKFKDYKKDIENYGVNDRDKHLFVYISEKEIDEVKSEGKIEVRHFSPHDPIESVINCVFEMQYKDELQKFIYENMQTERNKGKNQNIEYIKSEAYHNIEKEITKRNIKKYFIWGEGESGKSEMAEALARFLMERGKIYAPIWVNVNTTDIKSKKDENVINKYVPVKLATKEYITEEISKKVKKKEVEVSDLECLQDFLEKRQYLLVIDNLEFDNIDLNEVMKGINEIIEPMLQNLPYIIITSRTYTTSIADEMGFEQIQSLELSEDNIKEFFDVIIESDDLLAKYKQKDKYPEFIAALYEHYRFYPGLIIPAIKSIKSGKTIESLLPELKSIRTEGIDEKALIIYRAVFSMLDEHSQIVLFTLLDSITPDDTIAQDTLIEAVKDKAKETIVLIDIRLGMVEKALDNLVNKALIYRKAGDKLPLYGIKGVPFLAFMFGDIFTGQADAEKKKNLRKSTVSNICRLRMALRYERSAEIIDELENDIADPLELGDIYYQEAVFNNPKEYINKSIEYYKKAVDMVKPWETAKYNEFMRQYLQVLNRAWKITGSWGELYLTIRDIDNFLFDNHDPVFLAENPFDDTFVNPKLLKEIGDIHYEFGFYIQRIEAYFELANWMYEYALRLYSRETDIRAIRAVKIKQAINLGGWADVTENKIAILEQAKNILTDIIYFDKFDVNQEVDPLEFADKEMALAKVYRKLSRLLEDKQYKEKSINTYINARNIYYKEKERIKYGIAWAELSVAYRICSPAVEDIDLSINACEEALKIFHRYDFPVYYAETMNHLGTAYKAFVKEKDDTFFKENLRVFREAEGIFQEREMYHFMTGRVKHNIGDLYHKYALNSFHDNNRKADLLRISINIFQEANEIRKRYPRYHIDTLLFQGQAYLDLAEILPDDNEEKVYRLREAIETLETGIEICINHSIEARYNYKWLHHNNSLAHERLYRFSRDPKDIDRALSDVRKAMEYANTAEKEKMEADYSRMMDIKAAM